MLRVLLTGAVVAGLAAAPAAHAAVKPAAKQFSSRLAQSSRADVTLSVDQSGRVAYFEVKGLRCVRKGDPAAYSRPVAVRGGRFSFTRTRGAFTVKGAKWVSGDRLQVAGTFTTSHSATGRVRFRMAKGERRCDSGWVRWNANAPDPVRISSYIPSSFELPGELRLTVRLFNQGNRPSGGTVVRFNLKEAIDDQPEPGSYAGPWYWRPFVASVSGLSTHGSCGPVAYEPLYGWEAHPYVVCRLGTLAAQSTAVVTLVEQWPAGNGPLCEQEPGFGVYLDAWYQTALNESDGQLQPVPSREGGAHPPGCSD